jgi:rhodanese-related sulfurtransferase
MMATTVSIEPDATMREVLEAFPGAQRALFRQYHIGGCSSCAFRPDETLRQVCERNGGLNVDDVLAHIRTSHEADERVFISASDLARWIKEEFDAVRIEGSILLSLPVMREILAEGTNDRPLVIVDHQGRQALDAAAYFLGHGLKKVRCLLGGIDAWSRQVDSNLPRYKIELEDTGPGHATIA